VVGERPSLVLRHAERKVSDVRVGNPSLVFFLRTNLWGGGWSGRAWSLDLSPLSGRETPEGDC
jgi:hypothetical protein